MTDLEYRIGGLKVNPHKLRYMGSDPYCASHKFVAEALDTAVSIYVAEKSRHIHVADEFEIPEERLVGGGSCYLDAEDRLILNDYSADFGTIPKEVAQRLAELMIPELQRLGVEVKGIVANPTNPNERNLDPYWRKRGFGSK